MKGLPPPMTSAKQRAANQRNARSSTGPRTTEGKATSSRNATTHGILSHAALITDDACPENEGELASLLAGLRSSLSPGSVAEELLVQQITALSWRLRRVYRAEARLFAQTEAFLAVPPLAIPYLGEVLSLPQTVLPAPAALAAISRYERTLQLSLDRSYTRLLSLQSLRRDGLLPTMADPRSPASGPPAPPTPHPAPRPLTPVDPPFDPLAPHGDPTTPTQSPAPDPLPSTANQVDPATRTQSPFPAADDAGDPPTRTHATEQYHVTYPSVPSLYTDPTIRFPGDFDQTNPFLPVQDPIDRFPSGIIPPRPDADTNARW
jgi:hypothetical protein